MRVLVTGTAGFIGFHLARRLIADGHEVTGLDGFTDYYDVELKRARHALLKRHNGFQERVLLLEDAEGLARVADEVRPEVIVHLAAQAGVRYSLEAPRSYIDSNIVGTFNVLETARRCQVRHLLLASTSSVYGGNPSVPFHETDAADHPLSLYAATKKATEAMSHSYAHLWDIPTTAFRFFTVYGPWGRPDMAYFKFAEAILKDRPIPVYNHGDMDRDFTYVDDLIEGIVRLIDHPPVAGRPVGEMDSLSPVAPWRVVNIGRGAPIRLLDFIAEIERALGRKARMEMLPMQPGDSAITFADSALLEALTGYRPSTDLREGVEAFVAWYREHYRAG
ncbi:MAG TPA: NAD-dependent epimerase/dehydratase family protein [Caulobacteraceae bacterium]